MNEDVLKNAQNALIYKRIIVIGQIIDNLENFENFIISHKNEKI